MKRVILFLWLAMVPAVVGAQGVTLDSCRSWARSHYPLVEQYGLVAQSAEYSVVNASRAWLPQVRLSAQATWQTDAARFPDAMRTLGSGPCWKTVGPIAPTAATSPLLAAGRGSEKALGPTFGRSQCFNYLWFAQESIFVETFAGLAAEEAGADHLAEQGVGTILGIAKLFVEHLHDG